MKKTPCWVDIAFALSSASISASVLGISFLTSANWPTGGDSASHLLYAWLYSKELFFSGRILPWVPEVFCGFPFLSYYFPMPFTVIALLSKLFGLPVAFKWGAFLASLLLPGAVFSASSRWLKFPFVPSLFAAMGSLAFLLHEQNSIWGGNLLSTLAGEFAYSYGLLFAALAMMAWSRAASEGRGWMTAALFEAACGFSHGFPLLVVGGSTVFLLLDSSCFRRTLALLAKGHLFAFCLLGGWLWPMIEMHGLTIPNDAAFDVSGWRDLLPATLWPALGSGFAGLFLLAVPAVKSVWTAEQSRAARYLAGGAGLSAVLFTAGNQMGLADIRFFPPVWLFGAIVCGWLAGQALTVIAKPARILLCLAACFALLGWFGIEVRKAPDWGLWNHSGLDAKPQWKILSKLFPAMSGDLWSPRLVFEHAPENSDIGSTRSLEALPMFLGHRPVLEGLYMESALAGPAVYQLQSEISEHPSSPLVRYPSGSLDPQFAAAHMNALGADTLLLRTDRAKREIEASGLFEKIAESPPFSLYRLRHFDDALAEVVKKPLRLMPMKDWMQDSFAWFRTRSSFDAYQPVYGVDALASQSGGSFPPVTIKSLARNEMVFETEAIGRPHLVKMAYNPRWHLVSRGSLYLAAPGFMLVVPQEKEIHLVYGHTPVGKLGMASTLASAIFLLLYSRRREKPVQQQTSRLLPLFAAWGLLALCGIYLGMHSSERIYNLAWDDMRANRYSDAAPLFLEAYRLRSPPAKKEEALFWLAKSSELAGNRKDAIVRYRELCENYRGYWVPESLYTLVRLERLEGEQASQYESRLRGEYPGNPWTHKLENHP